VPSVHDGRIDSEPFCSVRSLLDALQRERTPRGAE
jgi:hypothetical protein